MKKVILSIGGNTLIRRVDRGTIEEQFENARDACRSITDILSSGASVIITHGNGPIVGNIVIRGEAARKVVPPMPLFISDADSEGGVGFMIQQTIYNQLKLTHVEAGVVTVVTQVVVDPDDEAFTRPTKPIGPYYSEEEAQRLLEKRGWTMVEDSGRGFRRVVPSPMPVKVVESDVIKDLAERGVIVIAAGGGGVPVVEEQDGTLRGVDAVIDKDHATTLLAIETGVSTIINLTQVDAAYINFGRPDERPLHRLTAAEAKELLARGEFAPGSMGPKIEAAVRFIEAGGEEVIITCPALAREAMKAAAGTRIVPA